MISSPILNLFHYNMTLMQPEISKYRVTNRAAS